MRAAPTSCKFCCVIRFEGDRCDKRFSAAYGHTQRKKAAFVTRNRVEAASCCVPRSILRRSYRAQAPKKMLSTVLFQIASCNVPPDRFLRQQGNPTLHVGFYIETIKFAAELQNVCPLLGSPAVRSENHKHSLRRHVHEAALYQRSEPERPPPVAPTPVSCIRE